jgi:putative DNA primase/helicase
MLSADERARRLRSLPDSDLANAEVMAIRYEKEIIFVPGMGFLVYQDGVWCRDPDARHVTYLAGEHAKAVVETAKAEAGIDDPRLKIAKRLLSEKAIRATVGLLKSQPSITVQATDLNRAPMLFNVANGTVDLRTGHLRLHDPADRITKKSPVEFDPDAQCQMWDEFMEKISADRFGGPPRRELVSLVKRLAGYLLTGSTEEQMLFFFLGDGANGKTTWIETMIALLGDYARVARSSTFMRTRNEQHPTDIAGIAEARFVYCDELAEDAVINEERMKSMTGEGRQTARFMHKNFFEFDPHWKIVFNTNHLPEVPTSDRAIWRRLIPIPFSITIPEEKRDRTIKQRLCSELPGILNWAIQGAIDWRLQGLNPNSIACVEALRVEYHEEEDHLGAVLGSICDFDTGFVVLQRDLYMAYRQACRAQGVAPLPGNLFGRRLNARKIALGRVGKDRDRVRLGLRLKEGLDIGDGADEADDPSVE